MHLLLNYPEHLQKSTSAYKKKKKRDVKWFLDLKTDFSCASCIHEHTRRALKRGSRGVPAPAPVTLQQPGSATGQVTRTDGTGGGHTPAMASRATKTHWDGGSGLDPLPYTLTGMFAFNRVILLCNNINCISYFTSEAEQVVLALRNCSITITSVIKIAFQCLFNRNKCYLMYY